MRSWFWPPIRSRCLSMVQIAAGHDSSSLRIRVTPKPRRPSMRCSVVLLGQSILSGSRRCFQSQGVRTCREPSSASQARSRSVSSVSVLFTCTSSRVFAGRPGPGREPRVGRTENSVKTDHRLSLFIMGAEHTRSKQAQLAAALAQGKSVAAWRNTTRCPYRRLTGGRETPKSARRSRLVAAALDRVVGMMVKRTTKSVVGIGALADEAESESVRLKRTSQI